MHRILINAKVGQIVDHINGNPLDNRKSNLRIVSFSDNQHNTHKERKTLYGVGIYKKGNRFYSHIRNEGKWFSIGAFRTIEEAQSSYWNVKNKFLPISQRH